MRDRLRIAITGTALIATVVSTASAQTTSRETGSVTIGSSLVWVRGTNARVVQLFVGRGFRDAFARPHEVEATTLQRWIDSVRALTPPSATDSTPDDAQMRASILSTDVTMMRRVGGPMSGLRLLVSGEDPISMPELTAKDFLVALDSAVHVTRELSAPAAPAVAVAETVLPTVAQSPAAPVPPAAAPAVLPPATRSVSSPAPAPLGASTSEPPPELVLPAPSEPVILLASRVDIMPLPAPVVRPPVVPTPVVPAPVVPAPVVPASAPDTVLPPHVDVPADKLIHTPLGPFTVPGALLADRDAEAQYCYRQLGLKYNPDLKGEITLKLTLSGDGTVQDAVVTKRSWQGISAGEVEACVRAVARDWRFSATDPTITGGSKLLTFSFAP